MGSAASAIPLVAQWLALFEKIGPNALLVEHAPVSLLAAHVAGLPAVRLGSTFTAPPAGEAGASLLPWAGHNAAELAVAQRPADVAVREVCRHFGAPALAGLGELLARAPLHALAWEELDHYGPGAAGFYYGPLVGIDADARPEWPAGKGPRTLVYLPFDQPGALVVAEALSRLGWPVLWHSASAPPAALPATIRYSAAPIDLGAAGREASLYVGRGGYCASAQMLGVGVPQLLLPDRLESLLLTYRLRLAGVAHSQAASAGVEPVREALRRVAGSDRIRQRAAQVAARSGDFSAGAMTQLLAQDVMLSLGR
jgi:UDP:flavonoid glycosyltransferase YjiC (YdhE family)